MVQLHHIIRQTENRSGKRVGRGGKRGKTAGRGTKGQKARAGHRIRPILRDIIKKYPKKRGYRAKAFRTPATAVNLFTLEKHFAGGETVSSETLVAKGLVSKKGRAIAPIKILATGTLTKKLSVVGLTVSKAAQSAIEKAGGTVA